MPFFRKSASTPISAGGYEPTSIDQHGFEVVIDKAGPHELNPAHLLFTETIIERYRRTQETGLVATPFAARFVPRILIESHDSTRDEAARAMCARGVELLNAEPGRISVMARRTADAADAFLRTSAAKKDPLLHTLARDIRRRARETLAYRLDKAVGTNRLNSRSDDYAALARTRAIAMSEHFGVYDARAELGVDFVLDAHGKVAYAFKPLVEQAPLALCASRVHRGLGMALRNSANDAPGRSFDESLSFIVTMPGRRGSDARDTAGLLMQVPEGFDLCLSDLDDHDDRDRDDRDGDAGRRLAAALKRPVSGDTFDKLGLLALCTGGSDPRLDGVLVDEQDRFWILDPERLLADQPMQAEGLSNGASDQTAAATARHALRDGPVNSALLVALSTLSGDDVSVSNDLAEIWTPTQRELRVIARAMGIADSGDLEAVKRLWPAPATLERTSRRVETISAWAKSCLTLQEALLRQRPEEVEGLQKVLDLQSALTGIRSELSREDATSTVVVEAPADPAQASEPSHIAG